MIEAVVIIDEEIWIGIDVDTTPHVVATEIVARPSHVRIDLVPERSAGY
jgi:hypothetical protein